MTYGTGTSNAPEEHDAGCRDVTTLAPVRSGQLDDIRGEVDDIEASGYTPMGSALRQAAEELPAEGERSIVLVSDGIDTCAPPPVCEVAEELHDQGIDLIINTVGFLVDDEARSELECIADAGGGQYLDADDAESLAESMKILHSRSINAYESDLEEYEGSANESEPTQIPADVEAFSSPLHDHGTAFNDINGDAQHWRIPVEESERVALSALTVQPPSFGGLTDGRFGLDLEFTDFSCQASTWSDADSSSAQGVQSAAALSVHMGEDCGDEGYVDFSLTRRGKYLRGQDIPVELKITRLVGEDTSAVPEPEEASDIPAVELPDNAEDASPGTWFEDAAELPTAEDAAVATDIVPGETHFYKVPVEYGQRLAAAIKSGGTDVERAPGVSVDQLEVNIYNQARQPVASPESVTLTSDEPKTIGHKAPLNYRVIDGGTSATERLWQDGEQYIAVKYMRIAGGGNEEVGDAEQHTARYTLAALVDGEPQPGPTFEAAAQPGTSDDAADADTAKDSEETETAAENSDEGFGVLGWARCAGAHCRSGGISAPPEVMTAEITAVVTVGSGWRGIPKLPSRGGYLRKRQGRAS
ncbi:vWA domain-containing protein [Corynebacterium ammoniagenes]|uniref:VWFA domain-containing protein n=2 Tax=Corynebacterium ammoniagenes TaxID=1697 RepID=A0AAV5G3P3_CORAM|nr:VWA domain-containing protein [Corynebacterium ammoniagenes]AQS72896.1 hypothetical protein CA40472_02520 [Corynebacterium ammoniagenes]EFG81044.1 hypothetical protein HMPREF0281_01684 [Corynebacterium ammoniagenes DSM 20306]GJN41591.1 hypothetical protein CAT723_00700 [Corynebacterium ammoniagenes]